MKKIIGASIALLASTASAHSSAPHFHLAEYLTLDLISTVVLVSAAVAASYKLIKRKA